jgi:hypothetical protein
VQSIGLPPSLDWLPIRFDQSSSEETKHEVGSGSYLVEFFMNQHFRGVHAWWWKRLVEKVWHSNCTFNVSQQTQLSPNTHSKISLFLNTHTAFWVKYERGFSVPFLNIHLRESNFLPKFPIHIHAFPQYTFEVELFPNTFGLKKNYCSHGSLHLIKCM